MNILYVLDFYEPNKGGVEVLFKQIVEHFSKNNKVYVVTWRFSQNLEKYEKKTNLEIIRLDAKNLQFFTLKLLKFLPDFIKEKEIDIVHTSNFYSAIAVGKLSKKFNIPFFLHVNGFFAGFRDTILNVKNFKDRVKSWKFQLLEKLNLKGNWTKIIAVSRYVRDILVFVYGVDNVDVEIVYNGIDEKEWKSLQNESEILKLKKKYNPEGKFTFLFYGRYEKVKNFDLLYKVFNDLKLPNSQLLALLHGDFNLKSTNYVKILPAVEHGQIPNWIGMSDCVVFPSLTESFGYVALETSLLNKPIIASSFGAVDEVVYGKVSFFNPLSENELSSALKKAYDGIFDENIPYKNFDIKNTLEKIEKLYFF